MTDSREKDELDVEHDDCETIPHSEPMGGTGSLEAALADEKNPVKRILKLLGPGLITGLQTMTLPGLALTRRREPSSDSPRSGLRR